MIPMFSWILHDVDVISVLPRESNHPWNYICNIFLSRVDKIAAYCLVLILTLIQV